MIDGNRVLAVITARGGSKGLPGKNVLPAAGKPLVAFSVEQALASRHIDRLVISSDDPVIIEAAVRFGCEAPFVRPAELARDESSSADVLVHALRQIPGYDLAVLLQPTSPLREAGDIDACLERAVRTGAHSCLSVVRVEKGPHWMLTVDSAGEVSPYLGWEGFAARRQELPAVFCPNGAVYVVRTGWFLESRRFLAEGTQAHVMPSERSLDIDSALDFKIFKSIIEEDDAAATRSRR
ncbi:MAG: acylneuraminate cytidylyltransferase family protein [Thermodesulfobacteriota bacterium]